MKTEEYAICTFWEAEFNLPSDLKPPNLREISNSRTFLPPSNRFRRQSRAYTSFLGISSATAAAAASSSSPPPLPPAARRRALASQTPSPDAAPRNVRLSLAIRQISGGSSLRSTSATQLSGKSPSAVSPPPLAADEATLPITRRRKQSSNRRSSQQQ
uniref:Uncharacterized protein n=1 Tax=Leersia perrieri TaxID=77586 RepID=A0A0D9XFU4_9ORYZ